MIEAQGWSDRLGHVRIGVTILGTIAAFVLVFIFATWGFLCGL